MKEKAIIVQNLTKNYGDLIAVNDISFEVEKGTVFAFLGVNGAGKSTTIGCITTTNSITSGKIFINNLEVGKDNNKINKEIGVVFQTSLLDDLLTVRENIITRAAFYKLGQKLKPRLEELTKSLEMELFIDQRYGTLSGGQKRRVDIARALIHQPSILFLDEPTSGLDPSSRKNVWDAIYGLQKRTGLTVFLTTHYMEETEKANMVYLIEKGEIVANGTPQSLRAKYSRDQLKLVSSDNKSLLKRLNNKNLKYRIKDETVIVDIASSSDALSFLKANEKVISDFEFIHGKMDDVFLELTNNNENKEVKK